MSTVPVVVKHGGQKHEIQLNVAGSVSEFRESVLAATGVPADRQKLLTKGKQIKDDTDLSTVGIQPNHVFMLLGSAGALPKMPVNVDMGGPVATAAETVPEPSGLVNVGNTCYANATLQALSTAPEFTSGLKRYRGNDMMLRALGSVFSHLEAKKPAQAPSYFLQSVRIKFPQFNETDNHGMHKQQDAEELWTQLLHEARSEDVKDANGSNVVDHYFEGQFETTLKNTESEEEPVTGYEQFSKLSCHITINTNFLKDGLLAGLKENIQKHSEHLGHDADYLLTKRISRLPKYLTVQFVRFFWRRDTSKKSKILRKVSFPLQLDVTDLCTDDLQEKIIPARDQFREMEGAFEEAKRAAKRAKMSSLAVKKDKIEDTLPAEKQEELRAAVRAKVHPDIASDPGANPYGIYDLVAVVTHQGMSADSGHYQAFTRNEQAPGTWWRFNDDKVSLVDDAKIETLSGGGESDSALILLYRTSDV